jgi:hypothetical protein
MQDLTALNACARGAVASAPERKAAAARGDDSTALPLDSAPGHLFERG